MVEYADYVFPSYEWDDDKRIINLLQHDIDFEDALEAMLLPRLEYESIRNDEKRTVAICKETQRIIAIVYTVRGDTCRIISARSARKNEKREYYNYFTRRHSH